MDNLWEFLILKPTFVNVLDHQFELLVNFVSLIRVRSLSRPACPRVSASLIKRTNSDRAERPNFRLDTVYILENLFCTNNFLKFWDWVISHTGEGLHYFEQFRLLWRILMVIGLVLQNFFNACYRSLDKSTQWSTFTLTKNYKRIQIQMSHNYYF